MALLDILGLNNALTALSATVSGLVTDVTGLKTWRGTTDTKQSEQDTRLSALETKATDQQTQLTNAQTKNGQQDGRLTALESGQTVQDGRLTTLETRATNLEGVDTATKARLDGVVSKNTEQDGRLSTLEATVVADGRDLRAVASIAEHLDVALQGTDSAVATLNDRVSACEQYAFGAKAWQDTADGELDEVSERLLALEADRDAERQTLADHSARIDHLEQAVSEMSHDYSVLSSEVTDLQQRMAAMEARPVGEGVSAGELATLAGRVEEVAAMLATSDAAQASLQSQISRHLRIRHAAGPSAMPPPATT